MPRTSLPATASATALVLAGSVTLPLVELGPLAEHMTIHIASMNVVAPLIVIILARGPLAAPTDTRLLWVATLLQLALLWGWHTPIVQRAATDAPALQAGMHIALLVAAFGFWTLLLRAATVARWSSIFALLLTGKFVCLLGALLIFAPRLLYVSRHVHSQLGMDIDDQQLAGLLMVTACPLSYLIAGIVLAAQMMADVERRGIFQGRQPPAVG